MRLTKRKQRRRDEQEAFEAVYALGGAEKADELLDNGFPTKQLVRARWREIFAQVPWRRVETMRLEPVLRFRRYRCPRCRGDGADPEQSFHSDTPPDPRPLQYAHGSGDVEPKHYRLADMHERAGAGGAPGKPGAAGGNGVLKITWFQ